MRWATSLGLAAMVLGWVVSLFLPVIYTGGAEANGWRGHHFLMFGWAGIAEFQFSWLANPLFVVAVCRLTWARRLRTGSVVLAVCLLLSTAQALAFRRLPTLEATFDITSYGSGYYVWLAVMFAAAAALLTRVLAAKPDEFENLNKGGET